MYGLLVLIAGSKQDSLAFDLVASTVVLTIVVGVILWDRRYRRIWKQFRARNWPQVTSTFDEGEIVRMMKGRSRKVAGYSVWLTYELPSEGENIGLYKLPFFGEFPTEEKAEECRRIVANQQVPVRVNPSDPKLSCILDEDVASLFNLS